ncbi:MAG TPA: glycosyltransferase [Sphingobacteriaceae bacterium]|nr:glycosyltransferase [Sphingobacteriaceae bacterium]
MIDREGKIGLFIPSYNAGNLWPAVIKALHEQKLPLHRKLIIDSGSTDGTALFAEQNGFAVVSINSAEFNHGGTRNLAVNMLAESHLIIFMTQDVIIADKYSLENLIKPFVDPLVVISYGRQLPHINANPLAVHARKYNYPENSIIKHKNLIPELGFKVCFMSNAFAAYRTSALLELGGFPTNVIIAEDTYLASKAVLAGYKIAYAAEATAYHSHNYSPVEEFKRYFDTGVFHAQNPWIRKEFGQPTGEGKKYVVKELKFVLRTRPAFLMNALISNVMKLAGFKLGQNFNKLPKALLRFFSMHKNYWQ